MTEAAQWQAVLARDPRSAGRFVYGVRSTGIYCRPTCPSRRPRRAQVRFFADAGAAEAAGFRACRRCLPSAASDPQTEKVRRACEFIARQATPPLLSQVAAHVKLSPWHLQRLFTRILGVSPRQYAAGRRIGRFKSRLKEGSDVAGALYDVGYGSSSRLYEAADAELGMTPETYRRGGAGMSIRYAIVSSPFGRVMVAATERGICGVSLGESDTELEQWLRSEYHAAAIHRDASGLDGQVRAVLENLQGTRPRLDLPLDVQASAFQRQVWRALQEIPYGATRTYRQIAETLGRPTAARAVARACATNPVSIVIPCHRVVRGNGGLGGYRWGIERKRALLSQEAKGNQAACKMVRPDPHAKRSPQRAASSAR